MYGAYQSHIGANFKTMYISQKWDYETTIEHGPVGVAYVVVSSPPAIEETGAMGREIESCNCIGW
jgi:hypothetical protein